MAESPSHKLGQLIGNLLEELIEPFLTAFANRSGLYLDYRHSVYEGCGDFRKYEVLISFTNGDRAEGSFKDQAKIREFLQFIAKQ